MNKYKYNSMNSKCKYEWGKPIGHDKTQFCKKCGSYKYLRGVLNNE